MTVKKKRVTGKTHYFRGTEIVDQAIHERKAAEEAVGLRPAESDVIIKALLASPYLFPVPGKADAS